MNRICSSILMLAAAVALFSCTTTKENNLAYFKDLAQQNSGTLPGSSPIDIKLIPDDEISVTVSSSVPQATAMYNAPASNFSQRGQTGLMSDTRMTTYIIDHDGNIDMPVIGKVHVAGMTTSEVSEAVRQRVASQVKDAYVTTRLIGFYVNVMGEVRNPQRLAVNKERFSVLDALSACGDLTEFGERGSVIVIRETNGTKTYQHLNLAESSTFSSPYFYLQQNDVVYVEPNTIKIDNSRYNQNNAFKLSVTSVIVSAASVIASLVIALLIK
ncbi:MAG: polysaccharide biosynthesis/export family protein [Bacteroidales bacterium]|nr:polysaccharide biosynthesis/export family protein [Candidatus Sodaliphilus aphodohippi]